MTLPACNCPTPEQVNDALIRGDRFGTKPACPVHDTPERLAALAKVIVPRVERPLTDHPDPHPVCEACGSHNVELDGWDIDKCQDCGHWRYRGEKS